MKPYSLLHKRVQAHTLTEILVVLVIIAIFVLLGLPNLLRAVNKAKKLEPKQQLAYVKALEKNYFYEHYEYSKDLNELGFIRESWAPKVKMAKPIIASRSRMRQTQHLRQGPQLSRILAVPARLMYGRSDLYAFR
jgi:type II secretory pathway pseudopilin PulG